MDTKQVVKDIINTNDPNLDTGEGSGLNDILIKPLSTVLGYYENTLGDLQNSMTISDPTLMSDDEMDALASNYLLTRREGNKATGYAKIAFKRATTFTLSANTAMTTTEGKVFYTTQQYSIGSSQMTLNVEAGNYNTGAIPVIAEDEGDDYTIGPDELNGITNATFDYVKVWNPAAFTKGVEKETNQELYDRIVDNYTNEAALSETSYTKILGKHYTFKKISIKGYDDSEMHRDIVYGGVNLDTYVKLDYYGKLRGYSESPYNENIAGTFVISGEEPPNISNVALSEFTTDTYTSIYKLNNGLSAISGSVNLLNETFSGLEIDETWVKSDAQFGYGVLKHPNEITLSNSEAKLGLLPEEVDASELNVGFADVQKIKIRVENILTEADTK